MRLTPLFVTEGSAMMGRPPLDSEAPRMKSIWPPTPEYMREPMESAQTWPVRSIWMAELMAVTRGFFWMMCVRLTKAASSIITPGLSSRKS